MNSIVRISEGQVLSTAEVELTDAQLETIFGADDSDESQAPAESQSLAGFLKPHCKIEETKTFTGHIKIDFDHFKVKKEWELEPEFR